MANMVRKGESQPSTAVARGQGFDPFRMMREMLRWDPFRELAPSGWEGRLAGGTFIPQFDVKETKDGYLFRADLPGVKESDLDISLSGNRLAINGRREEEERREEGDTWYLYERSYGSFTRSFTLPDDIDPDSVEANLKEGVLTVLVHKKPEAQPRKINVKAEAGGTQVKTEKAKA